MQSGLLQSSVSIPPDYFLDTLPTTPDRSNIVDLSASFGTFILSGQILLLVRSTIFNIAFYLANAFQMIFWTPVFFCLNLEDRWKIVKIWAYSLLWLQHKICGNRFEFRGVEKIPQRTSLFVAGKHQSAWETYTLVIFFHDPAYVLKRSLMRIPLFGWYVTKMRSVPIDRSKGSLALASLTENAKRMMKEADRQIILYPEGTRKMPGADPNYKYGITYLYSEVKRPVLPVALNSGLFWSRQSFMRYPGTIIVEFLDVIEPGLDRNNFAAKLQNDIETASNALMLETAKSDNPPPLALQFLKDKAAA